jgi:hypothetical protein
MGLLLGSGCNKKGESESKTDGPSLLARSHFVGSRHLSSGTDAAKLREIWALPETRQLLEQTLLKLTHAPRTFYGDRISSAQDERGAALLRPLLDNLLGEESFFQVRGPADQHAEWTLLIELPAERLKVWTSSLEELANLWGLGRPTERTVEGYAAREIKRTNAPNLVVWAEAGQWLVLSIGQNSLPTFSEALGRIKSTGRPIPKASGYWLQLEADLPRLHQALSLSASIRWPTMALSLTGAGENLRSTMRLAFAESMTGPLPPWRVPTNIIREPLVSFTAMRGVGPLLGTCPTVSKLQLTAPPNEVFLWAQDGTAFQTFWAWPAQEAINTLKRIAEVAPSLVSPELQKRGVAQIIWQPTNSQVFWKALPAITPFLTRSEDGGREYITGGLFPPLRSTNPPPPDLLAQFIDRTNLLYYDWEITQGRLFQWQVLSQLFAVIADKPQLTTNYAALPWLLKIGPYLGNTVTEITVNSPREWSLNRKSHLGLTGVELVTLARWLESTNFPRLSFDLPRPPRRAVPPPLNKQ